MDRTTEMLLDALKPFAVESDKWDKFLPDVTLVEGWPEGPDGSDITVGDLRQAKRIYKMMKG
jgi:hypothetical protein